MDRIPSRKIPGSILFLLFALSILFTLSLLSPPCAAEAQTGDLYVSPSGNDAADGTMDAPLRTLEAALLRANRVESAFCTVWLRGGTYLLDQTLIISDYDRKNIAFRAYPGEEPVITGAARLSGWALFEWKGQLVWRLPYDGRSIRALYGEDGARRLSRWPKEGFYEVAGPYKPAKDKFDKQLALYVSPIDLPQSLAGASIRLLHWWKDELSGIHRYDPASGLIELNRPMSMTATKGDRYYLENVLAVPLAPGEWAFDAANGWIYYAPTEGETIANTPLYAGVLEHLIFLNGTAGITFEGITFARTNWTIPHSDLEFDVAQAGYDATTAIMIFRSSNVEFIRCAFRDMGSDCIRVDAAAWDITVRQCEFERVGAQALYVHGLNAMRDDLITKRITFDNNHISGYGQNLLNAAAVLIIHARDVSITHNEIHGGTYTAVSAGWVWGSTYNVTDHVQILNNLIYNIGQRTLSDMGAVYLLGSQPNTLVSGNVIHDVSSADYGGWGIYLDEGSSGILVTNNLVYRCDSLGFHQHMGNNNTVRNNIFAFNKNAQVGISGDGSFLLERNLLVGGKPYLDIANEGTIKQRSNILKPNGSVFVDAENDNFNVRNSEEFEKAGFVPWVNVAGRYMP